MSTDNVPREMTPEEAIAHFTPLFFEERWKDVPGWPAYEVSDRGQLKSFWKRSGDVRKGELKMIIEGPGKILKPMINPEYGHIHYRLANGDDKYQTIGAAKLVLMAFDRLPEEGEHARHYYDPTPSNCNAWNLRWGSRFENAVDSIRHKGGHHLMKLTPDDVREIRKLIKQGVPYKEIVKRFGTTIGNVCSIKKGRSWKHIQDEPDPQSPPVEPGIIPGLS
jgi:hypothetical protein